MSTPLPGPETAVDKSSAGVRDMFSQIAWRYDFLNHLLSLNQDKLWRKRAARILGAKPGDRVLDLCCGTGDLSFELKRRHPECEIVSADFALPMLQLAQQKSTQSQTRNFVCADALALPLSSESFDTLTVAFGARNFEDTRAGLLEMARVLKPGGKVLVLEFMRPDSVLMSRGFGAFNLLLAPIGKVVSKHDTAYKYLPQSIGGFCTRREFSQLLQECGFEDIRRFEHTLGVATSFLARRKTAP